jgi:hypothetical protein
LAFVHAMTGDQQGPMGQSLDEVTGLVDLVIDGADGGPTAAAGTARLDR